MQKSLDEFKQRASDIAYFSEVISKCTYLEFLNSAILNELVERIEIGAVGGQRRTGDLKMYCVCAMFVLQCIYWEQEAMRMAKTTNINIRTEPDVKQRVENLFSQFGITVSDAVNIFFHQSLMQGGLPFQMQVPEYNAETLAALDDVDNNRNMSPAFDNMEDLMRSLNA